MIHVDSEEAKRQLAQVSSVGEGRTSLFVLAFDRTVRFSTFTCPRV